MNSSGQTSIEPILLAVLMPHAPVLVTPVGGGRMRDVAGTVAAMQKVSRRVVEVAPDALVLISPHAPRKQGAFGFWGTRRLAGSFARFGAPEAHVDLPPAPELTRETAAQARSRGLKTWDIPLQPLDHGALVPLWFCGEAGWRGPTVIISLNLPGEGGLTELGEAIAAAGRQTGLRLAVVASGDMSHSLQPGAPCGFHPRAKEFDHEFIELLRAGRFRETGELDAALQQGASEDVVDSTLIAAASAHWNAQGHEVLSYEGPFGVGYGVAVLYDATGAESEPEAGSLPRIARASVVAALRGQGRPPSAVTAGELARPRGVFVTLRERDGELRGCIGTLTPRFHDVMAETWHIAREAAFDDRRFQPVTEGELDHLCFEVSVVGELEPVDSSDQLDPARFGVVVSMPDGRRGALLPGIPEITTVDEQLRVARRKGRIDPDEPVRIHRFEVDHFEEPLPAAP